MAAAYAALVSLLNTMHQIETHHLLSTSFNNYPNESLRENIDFLLHFVENYSDADSCGEAEDLVRRIAVVAREAEDIIEVHAACVVASTQQSQTNFLPNLQRIIDGMDSIKEHIIKIKEETGNYHQLLLLHLARYLPCLLPLASCLLALLLPPASLSSSAPPPTPMVDNYSESEDLEALDADEIMQVQPADPICDQKSLLPDMQNTKEEMNPIRKKAKEETGSINQHPSSSSSSTRTTKMVGFDGYLEQLLHQLTGQPSDRRQILPIVGMGGIGKTTLARNVYDNLLIVDHFYVRAWVTVSQEFSVSEILLQALSCLEEPTCETHRTSGQLGEELHKILYGRRYLIVMDDVWSVEAWDKIKSFFPENNNGSRIVITTRQSKLVNYFGSSALAVDFLDDKNSWDLFCEKTFPQQNCPPELVETGKKIVVKCKGFPLAIVAVGGFLRKSRTLEYWEKIAKDKSLVLYSAEGNNASDILYLSYKQLPVWLKPCFLYFGLFPEDYSIEVSKLIKLWVAEGFIKSNSDQSLEEVAENYVNELVDRNLVLVGSLRLNKKLKTCLVHDLVRELCLRIAEKENFYCVQRDIDGERHFIVDERTARFYHSESHTPSLVHPLILDGQRAVLSKFSRLLRVWFSDGQRVVSSYSFFRQVNLRLLIYVSTNYVLQIPPSVSLLWSLQTLIVSGLGKTNVPCEIWEMPQLKHINISDSAHLPDPPPSDDVFVFHNLQTLATIEFTIILSKEVCKRMPNIKKLGIRIRMSSLDRDRLHNVGLLNKLESLRCYCSGYGDLREYLKLPSSLKKLTLKDSRLEWRAMGIIGALPHLQILKLLDNAVIGAEWNCVEGQFVSLKHLEIRRCGELTSWIADNSNFPVLETLSIYSLSKLEEIPSDIGNVATLEKISLFSCSYSAASSAVKILEEQENFGNLGLQVRIMFYYKSEAVKLQEEIEEKLQEEIEELDITRQNLLIYGGR